MSTSTLSPSAALALRLAAALPQTQCTRCGYPDCQAYAEALAAGKAEINQCPPGGAEGVARLAAITGRPVLPLNPEHGLEAPRQLAVIDEAWCIGCTLCIKACPADCIVGAPKAMHLIVAAQCTGCELCVPACPVDCISLVNASGEASGWQAWSAAQAAEALDRYRFRGERLAREKRENDARLQAEAQAKLADLPAASQISDPVVLDRKRAMIEAALARARAKRAE
ncbi:MAG: electron transport complex subunit RsxB [Roseateles asaccharophilus]|uniref:Electron transport complex protein RnfB n=1 Tax=Roseateles asaccharophilus TaxID=582607 RepID=A0A4R6N483_9BURK|nr:electron transport complex subunit RsxB [Roseateles asaccharophilus]MDN3544519.1 electron transport complex subunit RsxB [Roseateles asaccharophilus]TDP09715.1 electron transport complex protein RnfB [Roseateles asaccharophilus]